MNSATLRCVSLAVSASQGRKQRGTDLIRDTVRVRFHLAGVATGSVSQEAVSVHIPRTAVICVRTSMLSSLHQRPTQSWNTVFSRFCTSSRCSATQTCLLDVFSPTVFSRLQAVSCEDQSLLFSTSKLHHFLHTRIRGSCSDLVNNHPLLDHKSD